MGKDAPSYIHANQSNIILKFQFMPIASKERVGDFGIYAGETNSTYTHGYLYECIEGASYIDLISFDPTRIAFDYTKGTLEAFFNRIAAIQQDDSITVDNVKSGSFIYDVAMGGWSISGKGENGQTVFEGFTIYSSDLESYGFVFLWPMYDYKDGEQIDYQLFHNEKLDYKWQKVEL